MKVATTPGLGGASPHSLPPSRYSPEGLGGLGIRPARRARGPRRPLSAPARLGPPDVPAHLGEGLQVRPLWRERPREDCGARDCRPQRLTFGGDCSGVALQPFGPGRSYVAGCALWRQAHEVVLSFC